MENTISHGYPQAPPGAPVVLHVEDDDDHAELLARELGGLPGPARLVRLADGGRALAYLRGEGPYADRARFPLPDLVLLDLRLPGADGLEVLRSIKADAALGRIPVALLTSSRDRRDLARARECRADGYLVKPADREALAPWLAKAAAGAERGG